MYYFCVLQLIARLRSALYQCEHDSELKHVSIGTRLNAGINLETVFLASTKKQLRSPMHVYELNGTIRRLKFQQPIVVAIVGYLSNSM